MRELAYLMNLNSFGVIILAAGSGNRFGMPKALVPLKRGTFLSSIVKKVEMLKLRYVIITNSDILAELPPSQQMSTAINDSKGDMLSSLKLGMKELNGVDYWIIWPVDHPYVNHHTVLSLIQATVPNSFILPSFNNRLGHPIIIPKESARFVKTSLNLRDISTIFPKVYVEVEDEGINLNINYRTQLLEEDKQS
ncbi:MAG: hypothetical protein B6226_05900 [Candidatus Cloacimonetes bacterium 4572_65]|nr:MAG: hypothetical protein B6226_05900 [Candidatus Cloacimonetes bacterium 4572_65]